MQTYHLQMPCFFLESLSNVEAAIKLIPHTQLAVNLVYVTIEAKADVMRNNRQTSRFSTIQNVFSR